MIDFEPVLCDECSTYSISLPGYNLCRGCLGPAYEDALATAALVTFERKNHLELKAKVIPKFLESINIKSIAQRMKSNAN